MTQKNEMLFKEFVSKSPTIDIEKRQIRFLASTPDMDRDGEIIRPSAFKNSIPGFMKNSVFLACHHHRLDSGEPPVIGKVVSAWVEEEVGLWAVVQFAESELAERYWNLYRGGYMKAVSVGVIVLKSHTEIINGKQVPIFDEVEWIELSACAVPANRSALSRSKQRKLDFIADKIAQREAAGSEVAEGESDAFGLIGFGRKDFSGQELAEFSEEELAVLDLCLSDDDDNENSGPEPNYGAIAKGQSSTDFYNE